MHEDPWFFSFSTPQPHHLVFQQWSGGRISAIFPGFALFFPSAIKQNVDQSIDFGIGLGPPRPGSRTGAADEEDPK